MDPPTGLWPLVVLCQYSMHLRGTRFVPEQRDWPHMAPPPRCSPVPLHVASLHETLPPQCPKHFHRTQPSAFAGRRLAAGLRRNRPTFAANVASDEESLTGISQKARCSSPSLWTASLLCPNHPSSPFPATHYPPQASHTKLTPHGNDFPTGLKNRKAGSFLSPLLATVPMTHKA